MAKNSNNENTIEPWFESINTFYSFHAKPKFVHGLVANFLKTLKHNKENYFNKKRKSK